METPQHQPYESSETCTNMFLISVQERRPTDLFVSKSYALAMETIHRPLTAEIRNLFDAESTVSLRG